MIPYRLRGERSLRIALPSLSLLVSLTGARPAAADVTRTGYTAIVVASSEKCLDISGGSTAPGAPAIQWRCHNGANQQWNLQPLNGGYKVIQQNSGQCFAVAGGNTASGAQVVQTTCTGADAELWTFTPSGVGYQLVSKRSGLCAGPAANSGNDGANIVQSPCGATSNFVWRFASGLYKPTALVDIQANHSGKCMNVSGASQAAGANIIQWPCSGGTNEQWSLVPSGSNYQLVAKNSGLCLAIAGGSTAAGANLVQAACGTAASGLWTLRPVGSVYQIVSQASGLCLDVTGASQDDAAQIIQWPCAVSPNQLWSLSSANLPSAWTGVIPLAVNPIAAANLPDGKLLMWSADDEFSFAGDLGYGNGQTFTSVFDPSNNTSTKVLVTNTGDDMFCPGTANLPDGRILVNGGSSSPKTSIYSPAAGSWIASGTMNRPRGYQGDTLLPDGTVFTLGGSWSGGLGGKTGELWNNGTWQLLPGVPADPVTGPDPAGVYRGDNHLWLFSVGNGRIFHAGPSAEMHWITVAGNGTIVAAGNRGDDPYAINGNAVLYAPGTILKAGGAPAYQNANATTAAYVIQVADNPVVKKVAPMAYPRAFANAVVLPNGQVVVVGGQTYPVPFSDNTAILVPELWDPDTQVFRKLNAMATPRVYHSTALLLPDGRVYSGGGGQCGVGCGANHFNAEILTPPYLLNADGSAATRPVIATAPATAALGGTIAVTTNVPVASFVLIRLSSTTHTVNNDQRRVPLQIAATAGPTSYSLAVPSDSGVVLPGYYMLFALNAAGVPSVSKTVRVN